MTKTIIDISGYVAMSFPINHHLFYYFLFFFLFLLPTQCAFTTETYSLIKHDFAIIRLERFFIISEITIENYDKLNDLQQPCLFPEENIHDVRFTEKIKQLSQFEYRGSVIPRKHVSR